MRFLLMLLASTLLAVPALACEITFSPSTVVADSDGRATVTAIVVWEHRNCELDDDDVSISLDGIEQVDSTGWTEVSRSTWHNELQLRLTAPEGQLRVWRDCTKKGLSEGRITIQAAGE